MTFISALLITIFLWTNSVYAIEATHLILPGGTFTTTVTGRSCSTFNVTKDSLSCNPALFTHFKSSGIKFSLIGKAEGDSIETGKRLVLEPINEDEIRRLFQKNSYNSFSFNSSIGFFNPKFSLSYSPYYILGDISIFNPAFPEVSVNLLKRSTLSLSSGGDFSKTLGNSEIEWSLGQTTNFYSQTESNSKFTLFDLAFNPPDKLIPFHDSRGITLDLGSILVLKDIGEIKISNQLKNLFSKDKIDKNFASSSTRLQNLYLLEPYALLGLGKNFNTSYGGFEVNIENFFSEYYTEYDFNKTSLGMQYSLGLFSLLGSISNRYQSLGMHFLSESFNVGIAFMREKNIENYQAHPENAVYLGMDVNL